MAGKVPLHRPRSFERGAEGHHSERGDKLGKRASYDGDTGKSGYYRTKQHRKAIENANLNNAFAKHSEIYHK